MRVSSDNLWRPDFLAVSIERIYEKTGHVKNWIWREIFNQTDFSFNEVNTHIKLKPPEPSPEYVVVQIGNEEKIMTKEEANNWYKQNDTM